MIALVTGGAGFIGSNLALELELNGFEVVVLDNFLVGNFKNMLSFEGDVIPGDITDVDLERLEKPDVIFHQAAITDTTINNQTSMLKTNTIGFKRILDFSVKRNIPFIYASSASIYGNSNSPQREETQKNPQNIYAFSKLVSDNIANKYMKISESLIVGLRYFNVFGPHEKFKGNMSSMIWQLSQQMSVGKRPRIFKYGEQKRDQVYVKDVVNANILALKAKESCIVNIGSGRATSFNQIINSLNKSLKTELQPDYFDNPYSGFYQDFTQADISMAKKYLRYEPKWDFEKAVNDYMKFEGLSK